MSIQERHNQYWLGFLAYLNCINGDDKGVDDHYLSIEDWWDGYNGAATEVKFGGRSLNELREIAEQELKV